MTKSDDKIIIKILEQAEKKVFSYQCPYLAIADVLGYITPYAVKNMPSNFSRISMKKMLHTFGLSSEQAWIIYMMIELGFGLSQIAKVIKEKHPIGDLECNFMLKNCG